MGVIEDNQGEEQAIYNRAKMPLKGIFAVEGGTRMPEATGHPLAGGRRGGVATRARIARGVVTESLLACHTKLSEASA